MYQHRFCGITHLIKTDLFYLACTFTTLVLKTGQDIYYTLKRKKNQFSFIYRAQSQTFASEM